MNDKARELYEQHADHITLNGYKAFIAHWQNDFPTVVAETPHGWIAYEWSRAAIIHVITRCGGKFKG